MGRTTPALGRLLGTALPALPPAWGRDALLASRDDRDAGDVFADLLSPDAVDELIADRGLRAPFVRLAKGGSTLPESAFTGGGGVGAGVRDQVSDDLVRRQFADGATIVLQGLHRTWTPIKTFSQALAAELGHPVQVNAYVTPAGNQGFSAHYDVHDVFVVQITGTKHWVVHDPVWPSPLRSQPWEQHADAVAAAASGPPLVETDLTPGDVLYLPRGFVHAARALGGLTIHLTIGVHTWTRHHLAEALLDAARDALAADSDARSSLPLGVDVASTADLDSDAEAVRAAVLAVISAVPVETLADHLLQQARGSQRPESVPPIAQLARADALAPNAVLRLRPHLLATIEEASEGFVVRSRAGRCALPAGVRAAVDRLLAGEQVPASELGDAARALLVEGVAVVA